MKPQTKSSLGLAFRPFSILALMIFMAAMPQTIDAQSAPQTTQTVYLPLIVYSPVASDCQLTAEEQQVLNLLKEHPEQARGTIICHPLLEAVARARAQDMAERDYFDHVNPDGYGPNYLVNAAGYPLPGYYPLQENSNSIESIAGGYSTADDMWEGLLNSPAHRMHVLGQHQFYAEQVEVGIGHVYMSDSDLGHYWVIISAKPGP
jgi:uncharacterized protein YkwD